MIDTLHSAVFGRPMATDTDEKSMIIDRFSN